MSEETGRKIIRSEENNILIIFLKSMSKWISIIISGWEVSKKLCMHVHSHTVPAIGVLW